jgi:hypothetical protein
MKRHCKGCDVLFVAKRKDSFYCGQYCYIHSPRIMEQRRRASQKWRKRRRERVPALPHRGKGKHPMSVEMREQARVNAFKRWGTFDLELLMKVCGMAANSGLFME